MISDIYVNMKAEDYLELPPCTAVSVPVVLDKKAKADYEKLENEMLLQVDENVIDAGSVAVLTNKLLQLCNGAVYDENHEIIEIHDCKLEAFLELIEGLNGQPALEFYNYQHDNAEQFRPFPEPSGFIKRIPVLKSIEIDNRLFSVTFIRQYENCSVVNLNIDWDSEDGSENFQTPRSNFRLF